MADLASQDSFDFGCSVVESPFLVDQAGTWSMPKWNLVEMRKALELAQTTLEAGIVGATRILFELGVRAAWRELHRTEKLHSENSETLIYSPHASVIAAEADILRFIGLCDGGSYGDTISTRRRFTMARNVWAMYIDGAGTVVVSQFFANEYVVRYFPWQSYEMRDSYLDDAVYVSMASDNWLGQTQQMNIAENSSVAAKVSTLLVDGVEWVCCGSGNARGSDFCDAWSVVPLDDWGGVVHTYSERKAAWDAGSVQRGNMCGVVVIVRGQKAVLSKPAFFFDKPFNFV